MNIFAKQGLIPAVFFLTFFVNIGYAAPGKILDRPLFLGFSVQPNIYFVMDDSGSMQWDVTKTTSAETEHPEGYYDLTYQYCATTVSCGWRCKRNLVKADGKECREFSTTTESVRLHRNSWQEITDGPYLFSVSSRKRQPWDITNLGSPEFDSQGYYIDDILQMCPGYNSTAYNPDPSINYSPWPGYSQSSASIPSKYGYIPWVDADGDNEYDKGECSTEYSDVIFYSSMNAKEQQKFRNWYSYYRSRANVAIKAVSEVVKSSEARMGLATINDGKILAVKDMKISSNKKALQEAVVAVHGDSSTPLRKALYEAGEYFSGSSSPILDADKGGSCQQNYTVLMTDGYWNQSSQGVGDVDGTSTHELVRASDKDSYSETLADIAFKYYATDLSDLPDNVPTIPGKDENNAQHMVTFTVAFGVSGEIVPNSVKPGQETDETGMPKYPDQAFDWPKPESGTSSTIDDVRHAAWNGRGLYLNASNPEDLISALSTSINEIGSRSGTASAIAFNSTSYRSDARLYYARFNSSNWSGQLLSKELNSDLAIGSELWEASRELDKRTDVRTILTHDASTGQGVAFRGDSLPSELEQDLMTLYTNKLSGAFTSASEYIKDAVAYLRGDREGEAKNGGFFRNRGSRLGDIVNSSPVYIEGAMSNWPAFIEPGYLSYVRSVASRKPMLVVGANDGMLHGFDASNGRELFGYIPSSLTSTEAERGLHFLLDKDYVHKYYVDSTPEVADGYVNGNWKTLAVGGLGAGGKGIYALDVTSSSYTETGASSTVLWETTLPGKGLGLTYAQPKVAKMNDGRWVAIVANGYHNTVDGKAKIFLLDLDDGSLIKTFDTGSGGLSSGACSASCNGMSAATITDIDGNGTVDFIYAGDVKGNVWAINVASDNSSEWVFDSQVTYTDGVATSYSGSQKKPIYKTVNGRPITSRIVAVNHPVVTAQDTWPNQLLFFGSGQFIADGDHSSRNAEHFYGVMHANGQYEKSVTTDPALFAERVIKSSTVVIDGESRSVRLIEPKVEAENTFSYGVEQGQKLGWFITLPESGERVVHHPVRQTDYILFNTLIPLADPCANGGAGYSMAVSLLFGSNPNNDVYDIGASESIAGFRLESLPAGITTFGNTGIGHSTNDEPEITPTDLFGNYPERTSWQELR
jgi:type IV pilus assembly protein PilY1